MGLIKRLCKHSARNFASNVISRGLGSGHAKLRVVTTASLDVRGDGRFKGRLAL